MKKNLIVVSAPVDTYSGYGARGRDIVRALLTNPAYEVQILSQRWGNTRLGYLKDHNDEEIASRVIQNMTSKPDIWIQITIPSEFQPVGEYNIGITAGIETTLAPHEFITGVNKMDITLSSSNHSVSVLKSSSWDMHDSRNNEKTGKLQAEKEVIRLIEGVKTDIYNNKGDNTSEISKTLNSINEQFCYLFVGHWLQGEEGHDRKNISYTIRKFLETFRNERGSKPALILKTQQVTSSITDRDLLLEKIDKIRKEVGGSLPNIYLLHGDISNKEMNDLYNHPKVKAMVCITKGEGFGRPLLEFSMTGKPIISSGWSGQIDFLPPDKAILVGGVLENVHPSAANKWLLPQGQWFKPDDNHVRRAFKDTFKKYKQRLVLSKQLRRQNIKDFSIEKMTEDLNNILKEKVPAIAEKKTLDLSKIELPKRVK